MLHITSADTRHFPNADPITVQAEAACEAVEMPEPLPAPDSPDAPLLALAPELEAAASAYLAYDRDQHVTAADPDYDAAHARYDELHGAVTAVAERIFAQRPSTLPGLLMVAHAAAVTAEQPWEEEPQHVDHDGRRLRLVCDGLFRLVGVDWRGRPLAGAVPTGDTAAVLNADGSPDAAIFARVPELEAAVREVEALADRDQFAVPGSSDYDYDMLMARGEIVRKRAEAVAAEIFEHQPRTLAGLLVTARAVAAATGELWDAPPVDLEYTDTLLRVLPDKLFALCGVDCRGRPQVHGSPAGSVLLGLCEIPPDADLLALGRTFDAAFAAYLPNRPRELAAEAARRAAWDAEPGLTQEAIADDEPGARERWKELCAPFEGAIGEANRLRELADVPAAAAFRLPPPSTMAGLTVLARMLAGHHVELWDGPLAELEIEGRMLRVTLEAALGLAGVDRLGLPAGTPWIAKPAVVRAHPDADLAAAAAELDIEIGALSRGERRDLDEIPAYRALEARRMKALRTLRRTKARTVAGIEAKAHALRTQELYNDWERHQDIAVSLAEDIGRMATDRTAAPLVAAE